MNVEKELVTDDIGRTYPLESVRPFLAPSILQKMEERGQTAESMGTQAFFDACQEEHEKHKKTQYLLDRFVQDKYGKLRDYQQVNAMLDESFSGHLWTDLLPCTTQHYYETYSKLYKEANGREFTEKLDDMELSTMEALDMDRRYMAYRRMNIRIRTMKDLLEKLPKHPDRDFIKDYFDVRGRSQFRNVLEAKNEFYVATETVIQQLSSPIPPEVETVARRVEKSANDAPICMTSSTRFRMPGQRDSLSTLRICHSRVRDSSRRSTAASCHQKKTSSSSI